MNRLFRHAAALVLVACASTSKNPITPDERQSCGGTGEQNVRPDAPKGAVTPEQKMMALVAVDCVQAFAHGDFETAAKNLMGPEVCHEAPSEKAADCERGLAHQNALIRAHFSEIAEGFAPPFQVESVSFEPLPGTGNLPGAIVKLHPAEPGAPDRSIMIGIIRGRAYAMFAILSGA